MNTNTTTVETNCELPEFRITANTTVCVRSGQKLSAVPRRIEVHSSYHQLRKETHFSDFRTHAFPAGVFVLRSPELVYSSILSMNFINIWSDFVHLLRNGLLSDKQG